MIGHVINYLKMSINEYKKGYIQGYLDRDKYVICPICKFQTWLYVKLKPLEKYFIKKEVWYSNDKKISL